MTHNWERTSKYNTLGTLIRPEAKLRQKYCHTMSWIKWGLTCTEKKYFGVIIFALFNRKII